MNDLSGMDLVPEPRIVIAALNACRRLNDIALAIRFLETVKDKCGGKAEIFPYILQVLLLEKWFIFMRNSSQLIF
jgi:cytochrome c oxidase subunit 5a